MNKPEGRRTSLPEQSSPTARAGADLVPMGTWTLAASHPPAPLALPGLSPLHTLSRPGDLPWTSASLRLHGPGRLIPSLLRPAGSWDQQHGEGLPAPSTERCREMPPGAGGIKEPFLCKTLSGCGCEQRGQPRSAVPAAARCHTERSSRQRLPWLEGIGLCRASLTY